MMTHVADVVVLVCASGLAQATGDIEPFTVDRALAIAEQNNPQLRVADAQREGAAAGIVTARQYPNPDFNILQGPQYSRWNNGMPGAPGLLQHYSATQQIELPSVRSARIQTATIGRESSEFSLADVRLSVRAAVKQAFYQLLRRKGEIQLYEENLKLVEDLRRRIQVQVDVGEAARLELTRAEAEVATARTYARSAQLRLISALAALRAAMNSPIPPNIEPKGSLDPPLTLPSLDSLKTEVLNNHPALAQTRAEIRRAEARLRTEKELRKPAPTLHGEYERQPDLGFYRFGVSVPVPFWNRRQGPIQEAVAAFNQAEAVADVRQVELTAALERAYGQYQVAGQQVTMFQDGVLREAEAALQAAEAAFKFGERGIMEVLDSQRVLRSIRIDYLNAQFDRQSALIELEQLRAIGAGPSIP